jgi:hypothetical protein
MRGKNVEAGHPSCGQWYLGPMIAGIMSDGSEVDLARHAAATCVVPRAIRPVPLSGQRSMRLSRNALVITETDDRLIAAAAIIGDSNMPVSG